MSVTAKTFATLLVLAASASDLRIAELETKVEKLDGQPVAISGWLLVDSESRPYLAEQKVELSTEHMQQLVDIDYADTAAKMRIARYAERCVVVRGTFRAYGPHFMPSGYLLSQFGLIKDVRIEASAACSR